MRTIALSEVKDHLSEFVAAAEGGDEIIITRHGKPAAKLVAAMPAAEDRQGAKQAAFDQLAAIRSELRAKGMTATSEEFTAWKKEGQR